MQCCSCSPVVPACRSPHLQVHTLSSEQRHFWLSSLRTYSSVLLRAASVSSPASGANPAKFECRARTAAARNMASLHCNKCCQAFEPGGAARAVSTSCGHLFCESNVKGRCVVVGSRGAAETAPPLSPPQARRARNPPSHLAKTAATSRSVPFATSP